jgi:hypothetical protein
MYRVKIFFLVMPQQSDQIGANFRPLGDCLLRALLLKIEKIAFTTAFFHG